MSEFDQNLYDRLTADLEISEIKFSDAKSMTGESRWDSDYYQKHFLKNQKILEGKNSIRFWEMCYSIKKGIFDLSPENYIEAGIPFIRTTEIKEPTIRFSSTVFLDEAVSSENHKTELSPGDLVFAVSRWSLEGERNEERLVFQAYHFDKKAMIDADEAERLVTHAAMRGKPWLDVTGEIDGDLVRSCFEEVMDTLERRYAAYTDNSARENRDRVAFQKHQVDQHEARVIARIEDLIARLRAQNKMRTIRANEGRIVKARERAAERRARLDKRTELQHDSSLVCAGVIRIT